VCGPGGRPLRTTGSPLASAQTPRGIVDRHMDVSDAGRHGKRGGSKYRHDVQIVGAILNHHSPRDRGSAERIDDDLAGG